jgi:hypothetical protein
MKNDDININNNNLGAEGGFSIFVIVGFFIMILAIIIALILRSKKGFSIIRNHNNHSEE